MTTPASCTGGCGIYTSVSGGGTIFNIEWRAVLFGTANQVNFEVRLYEGQDKFDIIYGQLATPTQQPSIGVQRQDGSPLALSGGSGPALSR